ncbi:MAG: succinate dehydrogenase assembly factor 2 [Alphaproteobacteria bacterium]|nr:succinate dehydrogenase assembly factor 2 [Alphaproteobacteria bacterium]
MDTFRKKLIFRSWHRGTKEMDLILGSFADRYVSGFSESELQAYEEILSHSDPDLYNWITGAEPVPENLLNPVLWQLLSHRWA